MKETKKTPPKKKLKLSRESLRRLSVDELRKVVAGDGEPPPITVLGYGCGGGGGGGGNGGGGGGHKEE